MFPIEMSERDFLIGCPIFGRFWPKSIWTETPELNEKPRDLRGFRGLGENVSVRFESMFSASGEGGIRTHEELAPPHEFQSCALNRSATSPKVSPCGGPRMLSDSALGG